MGERAVKEGPMGWLRSLGTISQEHSGNSLFSVQGPDPDLGWGRAGGTRHFWKCLAEPPRAVGKGQRSSQAP